MHIVAHNGPYIIVNITLLSANDLPEFNAYLISTFFPCTYAVTCHETFPTFHVTELQINTHATRFIDCTFFYSLIVCKGNSPRSSSHFWISTPNYVDFCIEIFALCSRSVTPFWGFLTPAQALKEMVILLYVFNPSSFFD